MRTMPGKKTMVILCSLPLLALIVSIAASRGTIYNYDVTLDQPYDFSGNPNAEITRLGLKNGVVRTGALPGRTVFVKVRGSGPGGISNHQGR